MSYILVRLIIPFYLFIYTFEWILQFGMLTLIQVDLANITVSLLCRANPMIFININSYFKGQPNNGSMRRRSSPFLDHLKVEEEHHWSLSHKKSESFVNLTPYCSQMKAFICHHLYSSHLLHSTNIFPLFSHHLTFLNLTLQLDLKFMFIIPLPHLILNSSLTHLSFIHFSAFSVKSFQTHLANLTVSQSITSCCISQDFHLLKMLLFTHIFL